MALKKQAAREGALRIKDLSYQLQNKGLLTEQEVRAFDKVAERLASED